MARYKEFNFNQSKFVPISFDKQILPGTFVSQKGIYGFIALIFSVF